MTERGSISLLAATGALVLCLSALAAADLGSMLYARSRAQAAADAAALAAAVIQVQILGQDGIPEDEAREIAERDGATLVRCSCETGTTVAEVDVQVVPRLALITPWFDRPVTATARAEVDPDVLSYREAG